jgi:CubicO group peptidase (beta-lactamase class C family)
MRMIIALAFSLMPSLAFAAGATAIPSTCGAPAAMPDGWPVAAPAKEGLDPGLICSIGPALKGLTAVNSDGAVVALHPNSVVVVRHDTLAYEHYFRGYDTHTLHPIASISKSVVALLAGIASDQGLLRRVDARVFSYFPNDSDLQSQDKDSITIRDLLTMSSGLSWPELAVPYADPSNIVRQMAHASDPYRFVLARPLAATPGTAWNYNSGGVELLGDILMQVTHQPLDRFAQQALFGPLAIRDEDWAWVRAPNGNLAASGGLDLLPRDVAKIGQLVLNRGAWHGHQIVSAKWINEMTSRQVPLFRKANNLHVNSYGYLWWLGRSRVDDRDINWVAGVGWGGQKLYVVPSLDLVVAIAASDYEFFPAPDLVGSTALDIAVRAALEHGPNATASLKRLLPRPDEVTRTGRQ